MQTNGTRKLNLSLSLLKKIMVVDVSGAATACHTDEWSVSKW
jgi:hypothetical protein